MAAANIISVIGTGITLLSFLLDNVPDGEDQAKLSYIIANDGAGGDLSNAGGDLPDVRLWDDTGEFLSASYDPGYCGEGVTTCTTDVNTQEAPTYALFTGNNDAICIAWTGLSWAGRQKKYGFHPGNWAHACAQTSHNYGIWYYAGTPVPGIDYEEEVYCAWVDRDGDVETTGFQVHFPEFDGDNTSPQSLDYYCGNDPPLYFHTEYEPSYVHYWTQRRNMFSAGQPSVDTTPAVPTPKDKKLAAKRKAASLNKRMEFDSRIIKSHFAKHLATELCDPEMHAAGQSFVSYEEEKFCFMPTKTLFDFCDNVQNGACWHDGDTKVVVKGDAGRVSIPDLSHVDHIIVWE